MARLLGAGAMGVVYEAEDPDLDRRVAVKLLRTTSGDLRGEARMLARLAHPNVVAVYEVGTSAGRDFVAMEYVDGQTLADWLAERPRRWQDVARTIADAARGLAAAHAAGIIHRDVKPSNLLVGRDGRVRVTDFGLATRSLDDDRELAGTPRYMAPEVKRGHAGHAASDQYSLGVTLEQALPDDAPRWLRSIAARAMAPRSDERFPDLAALIAELERPRAGRRIAIASAGAALLVAGGLVVGAMRVAPDDPSCNLTVEPAWSAEALRARFLASGRSHASATVELVLGALERYRMRAVRARVASCQATASGAQSAARLDAHGRCEDRLWAELRARVHVLEEADPETVDRAVSIIEAAPAPESCHGDAAVRSAAGDALAQKLAEARARFEAGQLKQALAMVESLAAPIDQAAELVLSGEHRLLRGQVLAVAEGTISDARAAEATLREALTFATRAGDDRLVVRVWVALLSTVASAQGRGADALQWEGFARAALARVPDDDLLVAAIDHAAALARFPGKQWNEAVALLEHSLALRARALGDAVIVGKTESVLCSALIHAGRPSEAQPHCTRGIEIARATLGEHHPQVGIAMLPLAESLSTSGDYQGALAANERAVAVLEAALGRNHPTVSKALNNLAATLERLGDTKRAIEVGRRVVETRRSLYGADDPRTAAAESNLAVNLADAGARDEARALLAHALDVQIQTFGERHPDVATTLQSLGEIELDLGHLVVARGYIDRAIAAYEASVGPTHRDLIVPLWLRGRMLQQQGRHKEAKATLERALALPEIEPPQAEEIRRLLANR
ncbi:MAG: tetratricopeptide repeat protein [Kofleriaceae bacterium]